MRQAGATPSTAYSGATLGTPMLCRSSANCRWPRLMSGPSCGCLSRYGVRRPKRLAVAGQDKSVLDYATARGWRNGENPARWRGAPGQSSGSPIQDRGGQTSSRTALAGGTGAFMKALEDEGGTGALALQFAIMTATRTGEAIGAMWSEIDMHEALCSLDYPCETDESGANTGCRYPKLS